MKNYVKLVDFLANPSVFSANARSLFRLLELKSEFRHWIKRRIEVLSLVEGEDYVVVRVLNRIEYMFTVPSARRLALSVESEYSRYLANIYGTSELDSTD